MQGRPLNSHGATVRLAVSAVISRSTVREHDAIFGFGRSLYGNP